LRPRSIAVLGGGWAVKVIEECARFGFQGEVWPVHPTKSQIGGVRAYASVADLPSPPDATFVGVNRAATIEVVRGLSARGAGGAVLFASGFAETGEAGLQGALLEAAGEMPVLGPNCYGFVNALDGAVIWPDQQGCVPVERGVAVISQSSNIAITVTMQKRGLPLAYVVCLGNAAQTGLAEVAAAVLEDERVTALGLYVEGIGDAMAFADVVAAARAVGKGVVVLKAGRSEGGRARAVSHTAALAGGGAASSAYLRQIGAGEVATLPELIETLKVLHGFGPLDARRLVAVSCSGGEAGMMADLGAAAGVEFPALSKLVESRLRALLGPLVSLSNPLDYHTFIWGDVALMSDVFSTAAETGDAALFVLDPPRADRCATQSYDAAFQAIGAARERSGKPVFVVATLPDTIDEAVAARFEALDVVPLLGCDTGFAAIAAAGAGMPRAGWRPWVAEDRGGVLLDEVEAKAVLGEIGVAVPRGVHAVRLGDLEIGDLTPLFALKGLGFAHKSEAGAVRLNLTDLAGQEAMAGATGYLLEEMVRDGLAEVLIGCRRDPVYGATLTVGIGGVMAELLADTETLVCPVTAGELREAFRRLRLWPVLDGYRGRAGADVDAGVDVAMALQGSLEADRTLVEIEINPLILKESGAVAADALIRKERR
jgi:acetate---CoA ligase (ADP-forming)